MQGRRATLAGVAVALLCAAGVPATALAKASTSTGTSASTRYYLALGDSLSQGVQPNASGVPVETSQGYADQLYATLHERLPTLKLVKLGCPGDTTTSMLTGKGNAAAAEAYKCVRSGGSQEATALAFLKAHHAKGQVALVTVDIGANDVDQCAQAGATLTTVAPCVLNGLAAIKANLPKILGKLSKAAAKGTVLAGATLYDPFLADYLLPAYSPSQGLGELSVGLAREINADITSADKDAGFKTADVATAFDTYDKTGMVSLDGQLVPKNVAEVCTLTWACTAPPQGPNIHANVRGYAVIASTFAAAIGKLKQI